MINFKITVGCLISTTEPLQLVFLSSSERLNLTEFPLNGFKCVQHVLTDKTTS